ncbi:MAG: HAD family phosphatase [Oscillospiraceae bacterium]|nr:HAD family phosphatase [Oscillospiraceae bacterium]
MKKLLFFDIDGTLAYPRQEPPVSTVAAIRQARQKGHMAFLSTGRTIDSIPGAVSRIGFDGGIFSAGGQVAIGDTVLFHFHMEHALLQQVLLRLRAMPVFYALETADGRFHSENAEEILPLADLSGISENAMKLTHEILFDPGMRPMTEYAGQPVFKIAFHCPKGAARTRLSAELAGLAKLVDYDNLLELPISVGEISDLEVNKGNAIRALCHHLGMTTADCIAFGDSMNDSEMLQTAGIGVAMGNAPDGVKALADLVCDRCECDGIAKALKQLDLI